MKQYVIKRILSAIPLLIVISFVCFVFINLIPSDPAEVALRVRSSRRKRSRKYGQNSVLISRIWSGIFHGWQTVCMAILGLVM